MSSTHTLPIPGNPSKSRYAREVIRAWVMDDDLLVSLAVGLDPLMWGMILADLAHHAANLLAQHKPMDRWAALEIIRHSFEAEIGTRPEDRTGAIQDG